MKFASHILFALAVSAAFASCSPSSAEKTPSISIKPTVLEQFSAEGGTATFSVVASDTWTASAPDWLSLDMVSGVSNENGVRVTITVPANGTTEARIGKIVAKLASSSLTAEISVSQAAGSEDPGPVKVSLTGKKCMVIANSMVYYGGFVQKGSQGQDDPGLLKKLLEEHHGSAYVVDCTYGNHALKDYATTGCTYCSSGVDHLSGLAFPLKDYDYVFLSEAGSNNKNFLTDVQAIVNRFKTANPDVKFFYINHVYSVYNSHANILDNLKTLREQYGFDIINCGQLAYDIYKGNVKLPASKLSYSDKYTFVNHCSGDTHHPNPLMGYIMAQMAYCALSGDEALGEDYMALVKSAKFGSGSVTFDNYTSKYYTTAASLPFLSVLNSEADMKAIQQLIPQYINKY